MNLLMGIKKVLLLQESWSLRGNEAESLIYLDSMPVMVNINCSQLRQPTASWTAGTNPAFSITPCYEHSEERAERPGPGEPIVHKRSESPIPTISGSGVAREA